MEWIKIFNNANEIKSALHENKPQLLIVHGVRITLVLRQNVIYALEDACPHNGQSLSKGNINFSNEIVCPLHEYRFQLVTGREAGQRCRDLKTFLTKLDDTGFYIGL